MKRRDQYRLPGFDYSTNGAYFVTICVKDRKQMLGKKISACRGRCLHRPDCESNDYIELTEIGKTVEKYIKTIKGIDRYVIMPNHVHLLIVLDGSMWASTPTIPNIVRSFKTLVTKEIGNSIWQRTYYDHIIRNDEDYLRHIQYIEENPKKWKNDEYY